MVLIHAQNNLVHSHFELRVYKNTDGNFTVYMGENCEEWSRHASLKSIIASYQWEVDQAFEPISYSPEWGAINLKSIKN